MFFSPPQAKNLAILHCKTSISIAKNTFSYLFNSKKHPIFRPAACFPFLPLKNTPPCSRISTNKGGILMRGGILKWNTPDSTNGNIKKNVRCFHDWTCAKLQNQSYLKFNFDIFRCVAKVSLHGPTGQAKAWPNKHLNNIESWFLRDLLTSLIELTDPDRNRFLVKFVMIFLQDYCILAHIPAFQLDHGPTAVDILTRLDCFRWVFAICFADLLFACFLELLFCINHYGCGENYSNKQQIDNARIDSYDYPFPVGPWNCRSVKTDLTRQEFDSGLNHSEI